MALEDDYPEDGLEPREPSVEDLVALCRELNSLGAEYVVIGGIDYAEAAKDIVIRRVAEVDIPFASPRLLWRMKRVTHREKDAVDLLFLRQWFAARGETPPD